MDRGEPSQLQKRRGSHSKRPYTGKRLGLYLHPDIPVCQELWERSVEEERNQNTLAPWATVTTTS
jgi:hypothetical protein